MSSLRAWQLPFRLPPLHQVLTHSPASTIELPCDIAMAMNLHLQGALEWLQWASPIASAPISQHSMHLGESHYQWPWGLHHSTKETEDHPRTKGDGLSHPCPWWQSSCRWPLWPSTLGGNPEPPFMLLTHCSSPLCWRHQRQPCMYTFPPGSYQLHHVR